mmetsp:Transcript_12320/g.40455  ORF Transcript_12320/g.40455 Transcript_12320/m.40455 type:complete len:352 (-) Transcript_12320:545-1600(-)
MAASAPPRKASALRHRERSCAASFSAELSLARSLSASPRALLMAAWLRSRCASASSLFRAAFCCSALSAPWAAAARPSASATERALARHSSAQADSLSSSSEASRRFSACISAAARRASCTHASRSSSSGFRTDSFAWATSSASLFARASAWKRSCSAAASFERSSVASTVAARARSWLVEHRSSERAALRRRLSTSRCIPSNCALVSSSSFCRRSARPERSDTVSPSLSASSATCAASFRVTCTSSSLWRNCSWSRICPKIAASFSAPAVSAAESRRSSKLSCALSSSMTALLSTSARRLASRWRRSSSCRANSCVLSLSARSCELVYASTASWYWRVVTPCDSASIDMA